MHPVHKGAMSMSAFWRLAKSLRNSRLRLTVIAVALLLISGLGTWRIMLPASSTSAPAFTPVLASLSPTLATVKQSPSAHPSKTKAKPKPKVKKTKAKVSPGATHGKTQQPTAGATTTQPTGSSTQPTGSSTQPTGQQPPATTPPPAPSHGYGNSSGLAWKSGASYPAIDAYSTAAADELSAFGSWRGKAVTAAVSWPEYDSWSDLTQSNSFYTTWAAQNYTKVLGVPLWPTNAGDSIDGCVNGDYNSNWVTFAQTMNSTGLAAEGTVIRLGWEMNTHTDWGTPQQYAACWRNIVSTVDAIAPGLQWDWNVNRGSSGGMPGDSVLDAYPGDNYVNIIGVDSYDMWPPVDTSDGWQQQVNGPYGLNYWLSFAESHGKKFSVPEWGLAQNVNAAWNGHSGGDDPQYIQDMYNFFSANSSNIAFESYFNYPGNDNSLFGPNQDPNSAAEYAKLWSA
jgi:hypothetical protein